MVCVAVPVVELLLTKSSKTTPTPLVVELTGKLLTWLHEAPELVLCHRPFRREPK